MPAPATFSPAPQATRTAPANPASSPTTDVANTATATATAIPGFDGWSVVNPQAVQIRTDNGALVMTLTRRALWFMQQRGVLLYKPVSGSFSITADIHASKRSDPGQPPGGNGSVDLDRLSAYADQLAVWGIDDPDQALRAFEEQLRLRIKPTNPEKPRP